MAKVFPYLCLAALIAFMAWRNLEARWTRQAVERMADIDRREELMAARAEIAKRDTVIAKQNDMLIKYDGWYRGEIQRRIDAEKQAGTFRRVEAIIKGWERGKP